jgi:hypothetical protein
MRHSDVRVTTSVYGHLLVEDLRDAVDLHAPHVPPPADADLEKSNPNRAPCARGQRGTGRERCAEP